LAPVTSTVLPAMAVLPASPVLALELVVISVSWVGLGVVSHPLRHRAREKRNGVVRLAMYRAT
jgi:hypothetical protein